MKLLSEFVQYKFVAVASIPTVPVPPETKFATTPDPLISARPMVEAPGAASKLDQ